MNGLTTDGVSIVIGGFGIANIIPGNWQQCTLTDNFLHFWLPDRMDAGLFCTTVKPGGGHQ